MELNCIQSPAVSTIPRSVPLEKPFLCGPTVLKLAGQNRACADARKLRFLEFMVRASGTTKIKSVAQDTRTSSISQKDGNLVFVAGATGRVGSRTVRELLKLGFKVRAGVRSIQRATSLVQSIENMKLEDMADGTKPIDKFKLVECDLEKLEQIQPALGNSSTVLCCIGASEKEIFDITGPYRIDFQATKNLIDAATSAKIEHFILLTSLGTNKVGFPAAILNLFWGVLLWKRKAEESLLASGLPYTIVRPGGMERPTDTFKETHNLTLSEEDTLFGGLVSNLQVAELMAFMAKNRGLSFCKVVEVIAETSAPLTPMGELLKKIPSSQVFSFKEPDEIDESGPFIQDSLLTEKEPEFATKAASLSPYTAYEDLKPPSSPTPTPSGSKKEVTYTTSTSMEITSPLTIDNDVAKSKNVDIGKELAKTSTSIHSPYLAYEDLKPPSSPSPSAPKLSENHKPPKPIDDKPETIEQQTKSKSRPLSPYTMYEDMKPPSSPMPSSPRKF